jgi:hypothetical protein
MAYNTTTSQGSFVSTGASQFLSFPSGIDWIQTYNITQMGAAANPGTIVQAYWQRPMLNGSAIVYFNTNGTTALNGSLLATDGFYLFDTTNQPINAHVAITAGTNAVQPVFSTGSTANLFTGSIVRVTNLATAPNLNGYDFSIDTVVANTSFRVKNPLANAPGAVSGAGFYQLLSSFAPSVLPYPYWYPARRNIVNITQANPAVITTSVDSTYIAGQSIRLNIPAQFGMIQANGLLVNIISVTGGNITVNLDTTGFTAFTFPLVAAYAFTPAQTIPVGEETDQFSNPNLLDDATLNTGATGVVLGGGIAGPAGQLNDFIIWIGGKTFNGS